MGGIRVRDDIACTNGKINLILRILIIIYYNWSCVIFRRHTSSSSSLAIISLLLYEKASPNFFFFQTAPPRSYASGPPTCPEFFNVIGPSVSFGLPHLSTDFHDIVDAFIQPSSPISSYMSAPFPLTIFKGYLFYPPLSFSSTRNCAVIIFIIIFLN